MSENITKQSLINRIFKPATIQSLQRTKKLLFVMQILFSVMTVLLIFQKGLENYLTISSFVLTVQMIQTSHRCDFEIMKLKIEKQLPSLLLSTEME